MAARWAPVVVAAWAATWLANRALMRIEGPSMSPTIAPGQLVVTLPARIPGLVRTGAVVVADDPRTPGRTLVKRVTRIDGPSVWLEGDNSAFSTDSRVFGPIRRAEVRRVVLARRR